MLLHGYSVSWKIKVDMLWPSLSLSNREIWNISIIKEKKFSVQNWQNSRRRKKKWKLELLNYFQTEVEKDFRQLRKHVEEMGWMKTNPAFYIGHLASILAFEVAGYLILSRLGTSWLPYMAAVMCFVTAQVGLWPFAIQSQVFTHYQMTKF